MLTIFTHTKPFENLIAIIQRNAIKSWTLLKPRPEIIVFGDAKGTKEFADELNIHYIREVARNKYGTPLPLLNDIFEKAENFTQNNVLCYVNADIILMNDFMNATQKIAKKLHKFLMVGQRWDMDVKEEINFVQGWEEKLRSELLQKGKLHGKWGTDYFVFSKGLFGKIPPFSLGRIRWDDWLVYRACSKNAYVIDCTSAIKIVHQNHYYANNLSNIDIVKSLESKRNFKLAGYNYDNLYGVDDATHILTPEGLFINKNRTKRLQFSDYRSIFTLFKLFKKNPKRISHVLGSYLKSRLKAMLLDLPKPATTRFFEPYD
ncbi:MAG: hypothetical protein ACTSRG_24685 [Candidatus Helarchaeota archaeon]